MTGVVEKYC